MTLLGEARRRLVPHPRERDLALLLALADPGKSFLIIKDGTADRFEVLH